MLCVASSSVSEISRELTIQRQSTFVKVHPSNTMDRNSFLVWVVTSLLSFAIFSCVMVFYRLVSSDNFGILWFVLITLHCIRDSLCYMIRFMEEEFQSVVGVRIGILFLGCTYSSNRKFFFFYWKRARSLIFLCISLYASFDLLQLVLFVGTKLQHVMETLALESAGISGSLSRSKFKLRDELFWFDNPKFLLSLIHFIIFQSSNVPKFSNWESEDNVPYTVYFDKARKTRGGKKINPNDPLGEFSSAGKK